MLQLSDGSKSPIENGFMRILYCFLALLLLGSSAIGREIIVDNVAGDDRFTGQQPRDPNGLAGAVRSIGHALQLAHGGDIIVLTKSDTPYRESVSLVGSRHSGTAQQPFMIRGNGAALDGSAPATAEMWENFKGAIFRLRGRPTGFAQLYLDGQLPPRVSVASTAKTLPNLQAGQWCLFGGQIYFCVEKNKLPGDYKLSYAKQQTGVTLFHVEHVRIVDLIVQRYQLDGINLNNSAREVSLVNVTCRGNGRSGIAVGGASLANVETSLLVSNGGREKGSELFFGSKTPDG
jgi:hypothetical protein